MNLKDLRAQWEKGGKVILIVTHNDAIGVENGKPVTYKTLYVIINFPRVANSYDCHRYFPMSGEWAVSVDVRNGTLEDCIAHVHNHFINLYPKET